MKKLIVITSFFITIVAVAAPPQRVTGQAFGFFPEDNVEAQAMSAMNQNASRPCELTSSGNAHRISDISLESHRIYGSYGRMTATASALFVCD